MLARFTQIDYDREMALVAVTEMTAGSRSDRRWRAMSSIRDGTSLRVRHRRRPTSAQHKGIGSRLMTALMDAARDHRLTVMEGSVLADNGSMLKLMSDLGFSIRRSPADPAVCLVDHWL